MRLMIAALAVFLLAGLTVSAQETYSINGTAGQVADLRRHTLALNRSTCARLQLSPTCNQATACSVAGIPGCSNAAARNANVRIWPDTSAGREEFITFIWVLPRFKEAKDSLPAAVIGDYCIWWATQNQTTREAECSKIGAPVDGSVDACHICP